MSKPEKVSPFTGLDVEPISTAHRTGLSITVGDPDCGEFIMHWDPKATNGLLPGVMGFWVALDGSFTWSEHAGAGPTYWRHLNEGAAA